MVNLDIRPKQFVVYDHLLMAGEMLPLAFIYNGYYLSAALLILVSYFLHVYSFTGGFWKSLVANEPRLHLYIYLMCPFAYALTLVVSVLYGSSDMALLFLIILL